MEKVANIEIMQSIMHVVKMTAMAVLGRNTWNSFVFCNFNEITMFELNMRDATFLQACK